MKYLSSQLIITEHAEILRNSIVRFSENDIHYSSIFENKHETSHTLFYDGIISPQVISLSAHKTPITSSNKFKILNINDLNYILIDLKNTIIDFETENTAKINSLLQQKSKFLAHVSSLDFIIACTALPFSIVNESLDLNIKLNPILWIDTDLIMKKFTDKNKIMELKF